jgi:hypothetical protein
MPERNDAVIRRLYPSVLLAHASWLRVLRVLRESGTRQDREIAGRIEEQVARAASGARSVRDVALFGDQYAGEQEK